MTRDEMIEFVGLTLHELPVVRTTWNMEDCGIMAEAVVEALLTKDQLEPKERTPWPFAGIFGR